MDGRGVGREKRDRWREGERRERPEARERDRARGVDKEKAHIILLP